MKDIWSIGVSNITTTQIATEALIICYAIKNRIGTTRNGPNIQRLFPWLIRPCDIFDKLNLVVHNFTNPLDIWTYSANKKRMEHEHTY